MVQAVALTSQEKRAQFIQRKLAQHKNASTSIALLPEYSVNCTYGNPRKKANQRAFVRSQHGSHK